MLNLTVESGSSALLTAWELWLVNKAKQERLNLEKKYEEVSKFRFVCFSHPNSVNHFLVNLFVFFHLGTYTERKEGTRRKRAKTKENHYGRKNSELATDKTSAGNNKSI